MTAVKCIANAHPLLAYVMRTLNDLRKLQHSQLKSFNKDELIEAIPTSTAADGDIQEKLTIIVNDIAEVKLSLVSANANVDSRIAEMHQKTDKQSEIILTQQLFLEKLDCTERERNLVLLGVPDKRVALEGLNDENSKTQKIFDILQVTAPILSHRRLGNYDDNDTRSRPILVTVESRTERDAIVEKGKALKHAKTHSRRSSLKRIPTRLSGWNGEEREREARESGMRD